jgi:hypothetical protein
LTWGTETARPTPGRAPRAATETGSFPVRLGVGGPAAPVTGVAAAREPGPGALPPWALLEVQPPEQDEEQAGTVRPASAPPRTRCHAQP